MKSILSLVLFLRKYQEEFKKLPLDIFKILYFDISKYYKKIKDDMIEKILKENFKCTIISDEYLFTLSMKTVYHKSDVIKKLVNEKLVFTGYFLFDLKKYPHRIVDVILNGYTVMYFQNDDESIRQAMIFARDYKCDIFSDLSQDDIRFLFRKNLSLYKCARECGFEKYLNNFFNYN